jgi:hypothetical protein
MLASLLLCVRQWRVLNDLSLKGLNDGLWRRRECDSRWVLYHSHRSSRRNLRGCTLGLDVGIVVKLRFKVGRATWDPPIQPVLGVCLWGVCLFQHLTSVIVERSTPHDLIPRWTIT